MVKSLKLVAEQNPHRLMVEDWSIEHGFVGREFDVKDGAPTFFGKPLRVLKQEHGVQIVEVFSASDLAAEGIPIGDGWLIGPQIKNCFFGIRTADCLPVLIVCGEFRAALHCGWRSAVGGILSKALARIRELSSEPVQLAIGPGAGPCCYEIKEDVVARIQNALSVIGGSLKQGSVCLMRNGKTYTDLTRLLELQAEQAGVERSAIVASGECTICDQRYFSYRREKALSGRQLSFIG